MARILDLRRQPFGKWLVLYKGETTDHGQFWVCQCACNPSNTVALYEQALVEGWTKSCGCDYVDSMSRLRRIENLVGRQIGKRLVVQMVRVSTRRVQYLCRCVCGQEQLVRGFSLRGHHRAAHCLSCAKKRPLKSGWYQELFVEKVAGKAVSGNLRYACVFANGSSGIVDGGNIRSGQTTGQGRVRNYGILERNREQVIALATQGQRHSEIAKIFGVHQSKVHTFFKRHPELSTLVAPPQGRLRPGKIASNVDTLIALIGQGLSQRKICREMGVSHGSVSGFLKRHPEFFMLAMSLPADEEFASE